MLPERITDFKQLRGPNTNYNRFEKVGLGFIHSWNERIGICCFSSVPARVVERPRQPGLRWERWRRSAEARAHRKELAAAFLREVEMLMSLQRFNKSGKK